MSKNLFSLEGRVAVVVGGTSGIGRVLALGLAAITAGWTSSLAGGAFPRMIVQQFAESRPSFSELLMGHSLLAAALVLPTAICLGVAFPLAGMPASARAWALAMPFTHYIRLQIEQLQMGAPLATSVSTMVGLLVAAGILWLVSAAGLRLAAQRPESWGGR